MLFKMFMRTRLITVVMLLELFPILGPRLSMLRAQGTAFSYQGCLNDNNGPANGAYDLTFTLYATNTGGASVAGPVTNTATAVTNGLFTSMIDFGNVFD